MSDKDNQPMISNHFVEWYATQLEGFLATEGHEAEDVLKYILCKLEGQQELPTKANKP